MTILLDVNLLMALLWKNHEHHDVARGWLRRVTGFATCPVCQLGFAKVSSHPSLGYSMSPDEPFGVLRRALAQCSARHFHMKRAPIWASGRNRRPPLVNRTKPYRS
jgi:predicted nucleic acid-binding protein